MTATTNAPTSPTVPPAVQPAYRSHARAFAVIALALGMVLVVVAVGVHLRAESAYRLSFATSVPPEKRTAGSTLAHRLQPWDARFATRATVMREWLRGSQLLAQAKYLLAVDALAAAYRRDVGDRELLALFVKSQDLLALDTNWKAHVQHAREGPGGALRPQDVIR